MDFGLAKSLGMSSWHAITREGEGLGTPCYMPPEQVRDARKADQRSDIYSLGASLYHMLTGQYPVQARNYNEFITFILERDPVPVETLRSDCPSDVVAVVRKTMAKNPDHRYSVPEALVADLLKIRDAHGIEVSISTS
jgi:serine/threonine-protein kinase